MATSTTEKLPTSTSNPTCAEGYLVKHLHEAFSQTVERFQTSMKFSLFEKQYDKIYDKDPEGLKLAHSQLCSQLGTNIKRDLDSLCQSKAIEPLLSSLNNIIIKNQDKTDEMAWRPSGNPDEDLRDHVYALKLKNKECLEEMLSKLSSQNEELMNMVIMNHAEIVSMKRKTDDLNEEFKKIMHPLNEVKVDKLQFSKIEELEGP